jgi:hypothetical protein
VPEPQPVNPSHLAPVPPAIRRQAEQADRLQRQSLGHPEPAGDVVPPQPAPPPPAPPQPQPPPQPTPPAAELATVQGRLDAEREQSQQLRGQVASLERMVSELQRQNRQTPPQPAAEPPRQRNKLITAEEEAEYGSDLMATIGKRARDEVAGEIDELKGHIRDLQGQLGQVGQRVQARDEGDLFTELTAAVPGWVNQNSDRNFILWLQQPEPFSGIKRQDLLSRAFDLKDSVRVIRFFQGYLDEAAATGQTPSGAQPVPGVPPANGRVPLENFAAPGRATPMPASAPSGEKSLYTRAQISQFFTDKAAGKWRGREVEAANLEADIFKAGPEGRVVG